MVCGGNDEMKKRNKAIARQLRKDHKMKAREFKLLLLGTGESGKSTIVKQMRIIYGMGYTDEERREFRTLVFQNLFTCMKAMLDFMELSSISLADPSLVERSYDILDTDIKSVSSLVKHRLTLKSLWDDEGVQQAYRRRSEFQLSDSAHYYYSDYDRLAAEEYLPTVQDVLRARIATTGIHEFAFRIQSTHIFRMLDVGGQRSERRKWIHCFEGVTSIIFIVACSEYDQMLAEDKSTNRMMESLALFEQIINYEFFRKTSFILFLNKQDLLDEKVKTVDLVDHFPDFKGPAKDHDAAKQYIWSLYLARKPKASDIFHHYTQATDSSNIEFVFNSVRQTLVRNNLNDYGFN